MKRFVVLLVALTLCVSLLVFPAFAASIDETPSANSYVFSYDSDTKEYCGDLLPPGQYLVTVGSDSFIRFAEVVSIDGDYASFNCTFSSPSGGVECSFYFYPDCIFLDFDADFDGMPVVLIPCHSVYISDEFSSDVDAFFFSEYVAPGNYDLLLCSKSGSESLGSVFLDYTWDPNGDDLARLVCSSVSSDGINFRIGDVSGLSYLQMDIDSRDLDGSYVQLVSLDFSTQSGSSLLEVYHGIDVLPDVISHLFQLITDNPLLSALCAASLILVCIPLFVDLKKSAR